VEESEPDPLVIPLDNLFVVSKELEPVIELFPPPPLSELQETRKLPTPIVSIRNTFLMYDDFIFLRKNQTMI
jgi:hypothetical protein